MPGEFVVGAAGGPIGIAASVLGTIASVFGRGDTAGPFGQLDPGQRDQSQTQAWLAAQIAAGGLQGGGPGGVNRPGPGVATSRPPITNTPPISQTGELGGLLNRPVGSGAGAYELNRLLKKKPLTDFEKLLRKPRAVRTRSPGAMGDFSGEEGAAIGQFLFEEFVRPRLQVMKATKPQLEGPAPPPPIKPVLGRYSGPLQRPRNRRILVDTAPLRRVPPRPQPTLDRVPQGKPEAVASPAVPPRPQSMPATIARPTTGPITVAAPRVRPASLPSTRPTIDPLLLLPFLSPTTSRAGFAQVDRNTSTSSRPLTAAQTAAGQSCSCSPHPKRTRTKSTKCTNPQVSRKVVKRGRSKFQIITRELKCPA